MIRPYQKEDKQPLMALLRRNVPRYFHPSEASDFDLYLDESTEDYFVVEENGQLIGCGGINYTDDPTEAKISWDMVLPEFQGKGIGKELLLHRIDFIRKMGTVRRITVRTSQLAWKFYEKAGFVLEKTKKDYWAAGYDLYQMEMTLPDFNAPH